MNNTFSEYAISVIILVHSMCEPKPYWYTSHKRSLARYYHNPKYSILQTYQVIYTMTSSKSGGLTVIKIYEFEKKSLKKSHPRLSMNLVMISIMETYIIIQQNELFSTLSFIFLASHRRSTVSNSLTIHRVPSPTPRPPPLPPPHRTLRRSASPPPILPVSNSSLTGHRRSSLPSLSPPAPLAPPPPNPNEHPRPTPHRSGDPPPLLLPRLRPPPSPPQWTLRMVVPLGTHSICRSFE
ncbi:hypothetical protein Syun_009136 [Stephania yunnanensis]|uniref:Uncharacterized protein n=1 Tax=Stephania yunnanensis TaxID=152371 RepID=A0AAP0KGD8_9MAGN